MADFDPSKIFDSLRKETDMSEEDAQKITELTVRRIISSGMKFLSGPHIREIVCSVLSEQSFEQERKLYTRIGMPLMDYEEILDFGPQNKPGELINPEKIHHWAADQLAEEYTLLRILNDEESRAHLYGDIHLHKLKYFDLRPLSQTWDPRMILKYGTPPVIDWTNCCRSGPAEDLRAATHHLVEWLGMIQGEFSGDQGFNFITTFLAPYARGLSDDEIKHAMKRFLLEINQLASVIGRNIPVTSISYSPAILSALSHLKAIGPGGIVMGTYGEYSEETMKLFNILTETFIEGDYYGSAFAFPKQIVYIKDEWLKNYSEAYLRIWEELKVRKGLYIVNLCSNWLNNEIESQYSSEIRNFGTLQNISLNLPRYSYLSKDEDKFIEILQEKMILCCNIFDKKHQIIKKRLNSKHLPLCSSLINNGKALFDLDNQNYAFNIAGLNEAVKTLTNYELHENSDAFNSGKSIIEKMKKFCEELSQKYKKKFILQENFSDKIIYRFAKLDLKHFPKQAIPIPTLNTGSHYYTKSFHFSKKADLPVYDQIKNQGLFHKISQNGRNIVQVSLKKIYNQDLTQLIRVVCEESEIACLQFTA